MSLDIVLTLLVTNYVLRRRLEEVKDRQTSYIWRVQDARAVVSSREGAALPSVQGSDFLRGTEERRVWKVHWGGREKELTNDILLTPVSSGMTGVFLRCSSSSLPLPAEPCPSLALSVQPFLTLRNLAFFIVIYSCLSCRASPCLQRGAFVSILFLLMVSE